MKQAENNFVNAASKANESESSSAEAHSPSSPREERVLWTPAFIIIFSITLVFGLSAESLLTQNWLNLAYPGWPVLLAHILGICLCFIAIVVLTNSSWARLGGLFGCFWAVFLSTDIILNLNHMDPSLPLLASWNTAVCLTLLGSSLCFSLNRTPLHHKERWLLGLLFTCSLCGLLVAYYLTKENRSLATIERYTAVAALFLSSGVWWIRPSCWRNQFLPTLLFSFAPLLLLSLVLPNYVAHEVDFLLAQLARTPIHRYFQTNETRFFFFQVALLSLLLGSMRVLKCEIRN